MNTTRRGFIKQSSGASLGVLLGLGVLSSLTTRVFATDTSLGVQYTASCPEAAKYPRMYPADGQSQNYIQQHLTETVHLGYDNEPDVVVSLKIYQDFSAAPNVCVPDLRVRIYREAEVSFVRWYESFGFMTWHAKVCDLMVRHYQCDNGVVRAVSNTHTYPDPNYPTGSCDLISWHDGEWWMDYNDPGWKLHMEPYEEGSINGPNDQSLGSPGATLVLDTYNGNNGGGEGAWSALWLGTRPHAVTCCNL